LFYQVSSWWFQ